MDDQSSAVADAQQWLSQRAGDAFTEVQRADTKAAALCGVTGGLLALAVTVLGHANERERPLALGLGVACTLLIGAVITALGALRPVLPRAGLPAVLAAEAEGGSPEPRGAQASSVGLPPAGGTAQARRLEVLAALAARKLRAVRLAVDLIRIALVVAGFALLSVYLGL